MSKFIHRIKYNNFQNIIGSLTQFVDHLLIFKLATIYIARYMVISQILTDIIIKVSSYQKRNKQTVILFQLFFDYKIIYKDIAMQAQIDPVLEILPFDDQYAVRADIHIEKNSQKMFVMKTFLMFVLQIRSAMDDDDIKALKGAILGTCEQLLQRGGIDNVGFVINKKYHTIRNPNYQGIKDLLTQHIQIEDTTDIRQTIQCLRNSIRSESKKLQHSKISILMFTSNVAENRLNPVKKSYRLKMNAHIYNYQQQITKLGNTIRQFCDDCYFYTIGYIKKYGNDKQKDGYGWVGCSQYDKQGIDVYLLYEISRICRRKQFTYNICDSYTQLLQKFSEVSALMLYQFHQFSVMVPVKKGTYTYTPNIEAQNQHFQIKMVEQIKQLQELEHINDIQEDEQIRQFLHAHEQQEEVNAEVDYKPTLEIKDGVKYVKFQLTNTDQTKFTTDRFQYFDKRVLDLAEIHERGYHIFRKVDKKNELRFPQKTKIIKKMQYMYTPEYVSKNVNYHEPNSIQLIRCQTQFYKEQLNDIISKMQNDIIKYKKRFIGTYKKTKLFETYFEVNEALQDQLREKVYKISNILKQIYEKVFKDELIKNEKMKRTMFQMYSSLKSMIDTTNQVFVSIYKKQIKNEDIGKLSSAINYDKIKSSLKRKLIKRVNSNPKMIDQVYEKVEEICNKQIVNFVDLEAKYRQEKSEVGNCMYTAKNFATSLRDRDCLGVIFEIQRPNSAIADPGRIRIRQVSTLVSGVSKFFQVHQYLIQTSYQRSIQKALQKINEPQKINCIYCPMCLDECILQSLFNINNYQEQIKMVSVEQSLKIKQARQHNKFGINKQDYKENWDYWNRVQSKDTFFGIMPLYVCEDNWKVAKQLMKPCMGWTACGEPLGYTYSQTQTIPFMVLSSLIRSVQQQKYKIQQLVQKSKQSKTQKQRSSYLHQANIIKHKQIRHQQLLRQTEQTCKAIMRDMSLATNERPLNKEVIEKYLNYQKPINRTVDVISNNSCFLGQIYTAVRLGVFQKPSQDKFQEFFKRLVEEELRRETDGWNQEEVEDKFVNKLLNVKVQQMDKPQYIVLESEYLDRFNYASKGAQVLRTQFQIQRQALQMVIKENNKLNDTQRMSIIEYKRLYENRVLWFWYIRFRLYEEKQRISIHKWKCLDLTNYYQLFTMIIQNKKQRKNWKRREVILSGDYADPFDYYQAREFLQHEFIMMRNKKQAKNIVLLNAEKYGKASQVFAMTRDLREAAGAILNIQIGRQITFYYHQLCKESNFIQEKLKMLLNGEYEGVQLFKHGWKMSRKRMQSLRTRYPYQFQKYQYMF